MPCLLSWNLESKLNGNITITPFYATCHYWIFGVFLANATLSSSKLRQHIELVQLWSSCTKEKTPDFISPLMWRQNSPHLSPNDYSLCSKGVQNTNHWSQKLETSRQNRVGQAKVVHAVIAAAVRQWRRRLSAYVTTGGGHFKHCTAISCVLWQLQLLKPSLTSIKQLPVWYSDLTFSQLSVITFYYMNIV